MHITTEPAILYFGTPVVLISTRNEDGTANLAPMSSAFWLGWRCVLGLAASSKTTENLLRDRECVLNLPSVDLVAAVDRLAKTTGSDPVPQSKAKRGYWTEKQKFERAGLTPMASELVAPPRVKECQVQLETTLEAVHDVSGGALKSFEMRVLRVHLDEAIMMGPNRVDPDKWRPLVMSFQEFYGLGARLQHSTLGEIPEALYRSPDVDRARAHPQTRVCG